MKLSEKEISDGYAMLMRKAEAAGRLMPSVGQFQSHIILPCITPDEIELAIKICEYFAGDRSVEWTALPPDTTSDVFVQYGYVGARLRQSADNTINADEIRKIMLKGK